MFIVRIAYFKKRIGYKHVFISSTKRSDHSNTRLAIQIEKDGGMAWDVLLDLQNVMYFTGEALLGKLKRSKWFNVVCTKQSILHVAEHQ